MDKQQHSPDHCTYKGEPCYRSSKILKGNIFISRDRDDRQKTKGIEKFQIMASLSPDIAVFIKIIISSNILTEDTTVVTIRPTLQYQKEIFTYFNNIKYPLTPLIVNIIIHIVRYT